MNKLEEAASQEPAFRPGDIRVLLVDDNRHMRTLLREHLFVLGFKDLLMVGDGAEALSMLGDSDVDLVICDYKMPKMDGMELLQTMRAGGDKRLKKVCFIMLTGHAEHENVMNAKGAGVNGFLAKPISIKSLAEQSVRVLNLKIKAAAGTDKPEKLGFAERLNQRMAESA